MNKAKQVIVVNASLNMPIGKLAVQVAHASQEALFSTALIQFNEEYGKGIYLPLETENCDRNATSYWFEGEDFQNPLFTKIITYVKSEEKLLKIRDLAKEKQLPHALITDAGLTFFDKPTMTCLGIGPCWEEDFIGVTDKLRLLE
jgi:PTH2 family peptidyl-tRNA hydrolase